MAKSMYTKLATGPAPLAMAVLSPATDGMTIPLPFTPPGLSYLNSFLGGSVILGGLVPTAMPPATPQSVFGFTGPDITAGDPLTPMLEVTFIPEPGGAAVGIMGFFSLFAAERSRRCRLARTHAPPIQHPSQ
jgi:hypothetical protein